MVADKKMKQVMGSLENATWTGEIKLKKIIQGSDSEVGPHIRIIWDIFKKYQCLTTPTSSTPTRASPPLHTQPLFKFIWSMGRKESNTTEWLNWWSGRWVFKSYLGHSNSSTLAWKIPWTEEPGGLQSMRLQRVGHPWASSGFLGSEPNSSRSMVL